MDTITGSTPPWYDTDPGNRAFADLGTNTGLARIANIGFEMGDAPQWNVVDNLQQAYGGVTTQVNQFLLLARFNLYFVVYTKEAVNGSELVYTQRATTSWVFDGSGVINAAGVWQGPGGITVNAFASISDGTVVPVTTGTIFNNQLIGSAGKTWHWKAQTP